MHTIDQDGRSASGHDVWERFERTRAMSEVETVPAGLLQAILRGPLADPTARLTDVNAEPIPRDGFSGNALHRVSLAWTGQERAATQGPTTWVLKRWRPGGASERLLGVTRPLEAIAWERGVLRPDALPQGVVVPIIGARRDPGGAAVWDRDADAAGQSPRRLKWLLQLSWRGRRGRSVARSFPRPRQPLSDARSRDA
jgi:hypothetical protein